MIESMHKLSLITILTASTYIESRVISSNGLTYQPHQPTGDPLIEPFDAEAIEPTSNPSNELSKSL